MGLLRSQVDYGILLWGNSTDVKEIFKLKKMAIRTMTSKKPNDSCKLLFQQLRLLKIPAHINI